ncbi:MAG: hypothetical protein JETCAE03_33150 [Ignavibacteriaceae bacterium]|jgi:hypothetical protein|nr:MAG: hypothetical protein JETCAE03_33150 [Ignavibacteriaceae bacterium]
MKKTLKQIVREEIVNILLEAQEPFKGYNDIKSWADKNRAKILHKINFDKIRQNYPNLNDDQMEQYGLMIQYPYHSTFSLYDLKNYFKKLRSTKKESINEGNFRDKSKKIADIFNNMSGFRYYGVEGSGNTASIVAPSTNNRKWYGKMRDLIDKANIGDYRLDASQKPGYFILTFE